MPPKKDDFERRRALRRKKIRRRRLIVGVITLFVLALIVGATLSLTVLFPVTTVTASGSALYTPQQLVQASGLSEDDNLFTFSEGGVAERLRRALPYVETVKITRRLPGSVEIKVSDASEYACFSLSDGFYAVSKGGFVLNRYDEAPENLLVIYCDTVNCTVGTAVEFSDGKNERIISTILNACEEQGITLNELDLIDGVAITAITEGRFRVLFGTSSDLEKKIAHLGGMQRSIEPEKTGRINLSMWTPEKTEGTFTEGAIFTEK